MTPVHEIAFLVLGGALSCWTWPAQESPCPDGESLKIPAYEKPDLKSKPLKNIDRHSFNSYLNTEVAYEERGFAVFEIKDPDWYQVQGVTGEKVWLNIPSSPSWKLEKIEKLVGQGLTRVDQGDMNHLRLPDLKSPLEVPKTVLAEIHERQIQSRLKELKYVLPVAFVEIGEASGLPLKILAYEKPDLNAPKTLITMSWANWAGKSFFSSTQKKQLEHLYIFSETSEWINIQVAFGEPEKRSRWIKKNDLGKFKIQTLPVGERVSALVHLFESTNRQDAAAKIKELTPELGFSATGKTKWSSEGVLWAEVNIQDFPACAVEEPKTLLTAWLPYRLNKTSPPILWWYSRGC